jgi:hypothetical protein
MRRPTSRRICRTGPTAGRPHDSSAATDTSAPRLRAHHCRVSRSARSCGFRSSHACTESKARSSSPCRGRPRGPRQTSGWPAAGSRRSSQEASWRPRTGAAPASVAQAGGSTRGPSARDHVGECTTRHGRCRRSDCRLGEAHLSAISIPRSSVRASLGSTWPRPRQTHLDAKRQWDRAGAPAALPPKRGFRGPGRRARAQAQGLKAQTVGARRRCPPQA